MRLLLDTHILLWALQSPSALKDRIVEAITNYENTVYVSAVSAWEIAIKSSLGKLERRDDLRELLRAREFTELEISFPHVMFAGHLPRHHNDPFDRLLIAQAILEDLILVTHDSLLESYEVSLMKN